MTHMVEAMAFIGATPWHGIGSRLTSRQPIEVWQQQAGMAFTIEEAPVQFVPPTDGSRIALSFPEQKVLYRSDTKLPLSVVSSRYQVVQPRDILEFYRGLTENSGFELETAGVLKEGRKLWALARTGQSATLKGNDTVNGYLLLATACDGTLATTAQFTSIRVVCNNTLAVALVDGAGAVKVPHRTAFDPDAVKKQLGISVSAWDGFMYRMKALSERKVTSSEAVDYLSGIFSETTFTPTQPAHERTMKKVLVLYQGHGMGADLDSSRGTAFGLLNAITQYVDHERRARSVDHRLDSAWFGAGAAIKEKALEQALDLIA